MNDIVITIDWQYALGIVSALIGMAYYANGRFTKLETSMEWLQEALSDLKIELENILTRLLDRKDGAASAQEGGASFQSKRQAKVRKPGEGRKAGQPKTETSRARS